MDDSDDGIIFTDHIHSDRNKCGTYNFSNFKAEQSSIVHASIGNICISPSDIANITNIDYVLACYRSY